MLSRALGYGCLAGLIALSAAFLVIFPDGSMPDRAGHFLSDEGNTCFQILSHLLMFFAVYSTRSWRPFLLDLSITTVQTLVVQVSKILLTASWAVRPSGGYEGFPSGHASATFSLAFMLSLYYPRGWWAWYTSAALITWSRVQTEAHTLLQIFAGIVVGLGFAYGISWLFLRNKQKADIHKKNSDSPAGVRLT